MAKINDTISVTGIIAPTDSRDTYPVTTEEYNRGGYRSVDTYADMLAIPEERRKEGMKVYCIDIQTEYILLGNTFTEYQAGTGGNANITIGNGLVKQQGVVQIDTDIVATVDKLEAKQNKLTVGDYLVFENDNTINVNTGALATTKYTDFQLGKKANLETDNTYTNTLNDFTASKIKISTPTEDNEPATKKYVDEKTNQDTGNFDNLSIIKGSVTTVDPVEGTSIVNKKYVDDKLANIQIDNVAKLNEENKFTKTNTIRRVTIDDSDEETQVNDGSIVTTPYQFNLKDAVHKEYVDKTVKVVSDNLDQLRNDHTNDLNNVVRPNDIFTKTEIQDLLDEKITAREIEQTYVTKVDFTNALDGKVDNNEIYAKDEINALVKNSLSNYYDKTTVDAKLMAKADTVSIAATYTTTSDLNKLLATKADNSALDKAVENRLKDFQDLTDAMQQTEKEINANFADMTNEVNNVKTEVFTKIQDMQTAMLETSETFNQQFTTLQTGILESKNEMNTKIEATNDELKKASTATTEKLNEMTDSLMASKTELSNKITANTTTLTEIGNTIPPTASANNQLADKAYVEELVRENAARVLTYDVAGNPFPTKADLLAGPYFNKGVEIQPSENDYAIVKADEDHDGNQCRYNYDGEKFYFLIEYKSTTLTNDQQAAIDSGITANLVALISSNATKLNEEITNRENDRDQLKADLTKETTARTEFDNQILIKVTEEITARENDRDSLKVSLATETTNRITGDNNNAAKIAAEASAREQADLELKNQIQVIKETAVTNVNALKKEVAENRIAVETEIGDLDTLNTTKKTNVVEGINSLKAEIANDYLPLTGGNLSGALNVTIPGSGMVFGLNAADKGIELNLDASSGSLNIIPKSRPDLGFTFTANAFGVRFSDLPSTLGFATLPWSTVYTKAINNIPATQIAVQDDNAVITDGSKVWSAKKTYNKIIEEQKSITVTETEYNNLVKTNKVRENVAYLITSDAKSDITAHGVYKEFISLIYPVGAVYLSVVDTFDPNTGFGGVWEKVEAGTYIKSTNVAPGSITSTGYGTSVTANFKSLDVMIWKRIK